MSVVRFMWMTTLALCLPAACLEKTQRATFDNRDSGSDAIADDTAVALDLAAEVHGESGFSVSLTASGDDGWTEICYTIEVTDPAGHVETLPAPSCVAPGAPPLVVDVQCTPQTDATALYAIAYTATFPKDTRIVLEGVRPNFKVGCADGVCRTDVRCEAGRLVDVAFDVNVAEDGGQGFFDIAWNSDGLEGDIQAVVFGFEITAGNGEIVFTRDGLSTDLFGHVRVGDMSYVAPCSAQNEIMQNNIVRVWVTDILAYVTQDGVRTVESVMNEYDHVCTEDCDGAAVVCIEDFDIAVTFNFLFTRKSSANDQP